MSKQFYIDNIFTDGSRYYTGEYLDHNSWLEKNLSLALVEDAYGTMQGKTVRCNYNQIFYPDSSMLLCNSITEVDECLFDNLESGELARYEDKHGNEISWEEYIKSDGDASEIFYEIFQYYLIDSGTANRLIEHTKEIILYSEKLDLYVLGVTHFGTSWDYVDAEFIY